MSSRCFWVSLLLLTEGTFQYSLAPNRLNKRIYFFNSLKSKLSAANRCFILSLSCWASIFGAGAVLTTITSSEIIRAFPIVSSLSESWTAITGVEMVPSNCASFAWLCFSSNANTEFSFETTRARHPFWCDKHFQNLNPLRLKWNSKQCPCNANFMPPNLVVTSSNGNDGPSTSFSTSYEIGLIALFRRGRPRPRFCDVFSDVDDAPEICTMD